MIDTALPVGKIRDAFPALERRHGDHAVAYFDGPGGTQVPTAVGDAMLDYLYRHNANTHWEYPSSAETDAAIQDARETMAAFLNADAAEIAFGANMTTLTFHLARALGRGWGKGDELVVTELDHHANVAPWRALEKERGVTIRCVRMHVETGRLDMDHLASCITPRTRLVAIGAASNILGTITDVAAVVPLARAVGALSFVDAVHYAPHALVDVKAIGCDFLACSPYKFYGPHLGVLFGRHALMQSLDVPRLDPAPADAPERIETGTLSHEGIVGAAAAVRFIAHVGAGGELRASLANAFTALHDRGTVLIRRLWDGLSEIDGVTLYGPRPGTPRTPTVSFVVAGVDSTTVARRLAAQGIFASNGDFYAATAAERLGHAADGVLRAGCACYTTADEIERLIDGIQKVVSGAAS